MILTSVMRRLLVVVVVLVPRLAGANAAAPNPAPRMSALGAAGVAGVKTPLTVDSASVRMDCHGGDTCGLEVHYAVTNPTDEPQGGTAAFYGMSTNDMKVTVNGAPANVDITDAAVFDSAVEQAGGISGLRGASDRQGFAITVAPKATAQVVVTGTIVVNMRRGYDGFAPMADVGRHLLLTPKPPSEARMELDYFVAPIRTWGAAPKDMAFTLVNPADWNPYINGAEDVKVTTAPDGRTERNGRVPTTIDMLSIYAYLGERGQRLRGGVFAAIGGNVDDATGVRTRVGGELAVIGRSYFASLALEVESGDPTSYVIVPAFSAATPWILIIPSLGAGVGVPMRVSPTFEVGGRIQLDAHFGPVGYFVAFDWYPGMEAGPRRFEVAMMAQLSL